MKNQIFTLVFSLFISLISSPFMSFSANAGDLNKIKVCWESELKPPYLTQDSRGELQGIAVDLLQQIMVNQNIRFENIVMPWKRCLLSLQRGHVDLVPNSSFQESRTEFAFFSKELYRTHLDFFYIKDSIPNAVSLNKIEHFAPYKLGGVRGFNYSFFKGLLIDKGAGNRRALIKKLKKGRIDFAILQREVITSIYQGKQDLLATISSIPAPQNSYNSFYVLIGRKNKNAAQLVFNIDKGLEKLHDSGIYQQTLDKYLK